ncbi:MAG TPA: sulfotransferase [Candidatus Dormibacteraeota bacterium]|nr:sulfotransferase [Candidatus Dormibacteraeota bacterium]
MAPEMAAERADPHAVAALFELAQQGQAAVAEERAVAMLRATPGDGTLWRVLSVALLRQGKERLPALRRAAELLPEDPQAHAALGAEQRARGHWEAALVSLRTAIRLDSRNPATLISAGEVQQALGHANEARILYQEALRLDPSSIEALGNLGNVYLILAEPAAAVRCYRRALELKAEDAPLLCRLAEALRQAGHPAEALNCARRALAADPRLASAHSTLGLLLVARGERTEALASFREAVRLDASLVDARNNLGALLLEEGKPRAALAVLQLAVELDPQRADSQRNLGLVLLELRRPEAALEAFHRAAALGRADRRTQLGQAAAERALGLATQAEASCRAALSGAPEDAAGLTLLGQLHADRGQFADAQLRFEQALASDPKCVRAYAGIAAHRCMRPDDTRWLNGARGLLEQPLAPVEALELRYALGKYFDDVAEYDEAFGHYRTANELARRRGAQYDRARLSGLIEQLMTLCSAEFVRTARPAASDSQLPLLVFGMPRSGTTLIEQILASHPSIYGAGEMRFWDRSLPSLRTQGVEPALEVLARDYLARLTRHAAAAVRVTDKMPANFLYAGLIHSALPGARFIHVQRHPLDTCVSVYFQNFVNVNVYGNDLEDLAHYYGQYLRLMAHWREVLPPGVLLEVPYEGLLADPELWTRRMLEFAGLPWDARCLQFEQTERVVIAASRWQVRQKINSASVGRWRHYQKHLGPLLKLGESASPA